MADRPARPVLALAACVLVLAIWDIVVRPALASNLHPAGGLIVAACAVGLGLWGGLDADGLGLSPGHAVNGLRYGGIALGAVLVVLLVGLAIPVTRDSFHTGRADIGAGQLLFQVLLTIPLGTVVVEELAFRGAVLGLLRLTMPTVWAVVVCSVLFGLWHVPGLVSATSGSAGHVLAAAAGTFAATFAAGLAFCWLRIRSGSLLAPILAHVATNTLALVVAWFVVR